MALTLDTQENELLERFEADPGRFEPTTAFRIAQSTVETLEISAHIGVSIAPLPVDSARRDKSGKMRLRSAFPNLLGPLGALPPSYNDLALREERNRARALTGFLDLFSARITELFVDAAEKYRLPRLLRWSRSGRGNGFLTTLFALTGFGTDRLRQTSDVDDAIILRFAGFFAARTRNASNLAAMLGEFTGLPVRVELFRGRWLSVPPEEQCKIGGTTPPRLGIDAMAGAAIHDFSGGFRVVIGPLDYPDYLGFSPGGRATRELAALIRLFVGSALEFDMQIVLKKEQVPFCQLGGAGDPPRLGWNAWARTAPAAEDSGDAIITQSALAQKAA